MICFHKFTGLFHRHCGNWENTQCQWGNPEGSGQNQPSSNPTNTHRFGNGLVPWDSIGINTNIEVIEVSLTTWEAHHSPRVKPESCGGLPRSLMRPQWPKLRYRFLFYHDEIKLMMNKQTISRKKLKIVSKLPPGYNMVTCAHLRGRWLDCFSLVPRVATTVMSQ